MMTVSPLHVEPIPGTPIQLFQRLKERPFCFWLDSAGGPPATNRWSFLGAEPFAVIESRGGRTVIQEGERKSVHEGDPLDTLMSWMEPYRLSPELDLPPFIGGGVGWFSYDLARRWERLPEIALDDTRLPEMAWAFYATIYAYDSHREQMWKLTRNDLEAVSPVPPSDKSASLPPLPPSTFSREEYLTAIRRVQEYIAAGDIYQANLTQRLAGELPASPDNLYLRLREVNPAPFAAYLDFGETTVLSASPERFLSLNAITRIAETRPIKGTRPRSSDPDRDAQLADELLHSEKDRAENLMIVDVHRNDLGRVCEIGSIKVPVLWGLETYPTVHHLVSVVQGRLPEEVPPLELVKAAFPAGSITGAPKLRAMEIIEELEPVRRSIYTGSIGYLGWDGGMDLSVAIRTLVAQDNQVHYGVGGGIVTDSDPESEYEETLVKGRGLERALQSFSHAQGHRED